MLILPNGERVGMISGGCLERDLCRQAATYCQDGPRLVSFDTRSESINFNARYNLGCSGIIYILVEPVTRAKNCPLHAIRDVLKSQQPIVIGTVYQSENTSQFKVGRRIHEASKVLSANNPLGDAFDQVSRFGAPLCCQLVGCDENANELDVRILVEKLSPPKPFWIFGAGDDAIPMANVADALGWSVVVIDDRAANLTSVRFPRAQRCLARSLRETQIQLNPTAETAAVLMTHSFSRDADVLPWLCESALSYVGLLGPKSRTGKLLKHLHEMKRMPESGCFEKLRTPVGLDIGATEPAQIAVSIAAEIVAAEHNRIGGSLSKRSEPIHDPVSHLLIEAQFA